MAFDGSSRAALDLLLDNSSTYEVFDGVPYIKTRALAKYLLGVIQTNPARIQCLNPAARKSEYMQKAGCLYADEYGSRCGVGWAMPEGAAKRFKNESFSSLYGKSDINSDDPNWLSKLQALHDNLYGCSSIENATKSLTDFCLEKYDDGRLAQ